MKWEIDRLRDKVGEKINPLIEEQELLIRQFETEATNRAVEKLSKKMGADKIIARFEKLEKENKELQRVAKTFFQTKASKDQKENLSYKFSGDNERHSWRSGNSDNITLEDCEEQLRKWAHALTQKEIEKRPEGKELSRLKQIKKAALDHVYESNISGNLLGNLNKLFTTSLGFTWDEQVKALPNTTKN